MINHLQPTNSTMNSVLSSKTYVSLSETWRVTVQLWCQWLFSMECSIIWWSLFGSKRQSASLCLSWLARYWLTFSSFSAAYRVTSPMHSFWTKWDMCCCRTYARIISISWWTSRTCIRFNHLFTHSTITAGTWLRSNRGKSVYGKVLRRLIWANGFHSACLSALSEIAMRRTKTSYSSVYNVSTTLSRLASLSTTICCKDSKNWFGTRTFFNQSASWLARRRTSHLIEK